MKGKRENYVSLIARFLVNDISGDQLQRLAKWVCKSRKNRREFEIYCLIWDLAGDIEAEYYNDPGILKW